MRCLDDLEVLDYVERRLPEATIAEIRQHLDACGDCLNLVSQLAQTSSRAAGDGLTLGRTISSGGMGLIVEGWDSKLERRIALKLPRHDDPSTQRRFEREVKITARLQHPAIVPVYAAGTLDDGEPYYAMRLIEGDSLELAVEKTATALERLALVRAVTQVASAIAYAHSQGIIHRDIKPANVLVGPFGEVVVIDWGVARSLRDPEPDLALGSPGPVAGDTETVEGTVLGTPAYMAPEQARGEAVDERVDVYALGALLYHVLRGRPPGGGAPADLAEVEQVPVDLIAIVAEAMAPDPANRYRTAKELAADLERFQAGRLVGAHAYSIWELARRWLRKHRAAVAVGTLLAGVLAVTAIVASNKIGAAEQTATTQRAATEDLVDYMLADLQSKLAKIGKLDVLEGIGTKIDGYYVALGRSPAELSRIDLARWSRALDVLGDVAYQAGDLAKAAAFYERALQHRTELAASGATRAEALAQLGTSHAKLGKIQREAGDRAKALVTFDSARAAFAELVTLEPKNLAWRRQEADALVQLGRVHLDEDDAKTAAAKFQAALDLAEQLVTAEPTTPTFALAKVSALHGLGDAAQYTGDLDRAFAIAQQCVPIVDAIAAAEPTPENEQNVAAAHQRVGDVASRRGDQQAALAAHQRSVAIFEALTAHDPGNARWRSALALGNNRVGGVLRALGRRPEAAAAYERARQLRQGLVDRDPKNLDWLRDLGDSYDRLAAIDLDLGKLEAAEERYRTSLAVTEKLVAADPKSSRYRNDLYVGLGNMARVARARGDSDGAFGWYQKRLATAQVNVDANPSNNAHKYALSTAYEDLSTILMDRNDPAGARAAAQKSLELREALVAANPEHVKWRRALATSYEDLATSQDDAKSARTWIAKSILHRRALVTKDTSDADLQVDLLLALTMEARIARAMDDYGAASASRAEALKLSDALVGRDPKNLIWATHRAQIFEIGGDIAADQQQLAEAAREYRAAIDTLLPFLEASSEIAHVPAEIAESSWKLSKVVTGAERGVLVREAIRLLEGLQRAKRLSPDRAELLATIKRGS